MTSPPASACGGSAQGNSSAVPWSSLPDYLLTISYLSLTAPVDRVRFAAVCTAWRAVASPHLPCSGVGRPQGYPLVLRKVIFSEEPTLSSCVVAAITNVHELAFYKVGSPGSGWTIRGLNWNDRLMDIAFCNGELYGITRDIKRLIKYEFGVNQLEELDVNIRSLCMLNNYENGPDEHVRYILELRGNLVMVVSNYTLYNSFTAIEKNNFTVFELVHSHRYSWPKVDNLRDYALFVGPTGSKAVRVPASGLGEMQKNHIYFSHHRCLRRNDKIPNGVKVFLKSLNDDGYRVYYKKDESVMDGVKGIMSTGYYAMGGVHPPMWLFPERCAED
uniref:KIB1-4 beta-propeller domain-containing protein n=1 Tax=Aegilops tauschii TaxID=37682 RepID=N1QU47_AEGTA